MVLVVFRHVSVGWVEGFTGGGGGIKSGCKASSRRRDRGTLSGAYLKNRDGLGFLRPESDCDGGLSSLGPNACSRVQNLMRMVFISSIRM